MNLLEETQDAIIDSGHTAKDIIFIGSKSSGHTCTWGEFSILADTDYDNGFGGQKVAQDLIIVFSDGTQMWRDEYDGSEWWAYIEPFTFPNKTLPLTNVFVEHSYESLGEING